MKKFVIAKNMQDKNAHWDYCEQEDIPHIIVTKKGKYSRMFMDTYSSKYALDEQGQKIMRTYFDAEIKFMSKNQNETRDDEISPTVCHLYPVLNERIEALCNNAFDTAIKHRKERFPEGFELS